MNNVAVATYNGIGNFIQMFPAFKALKELYGCNLVLVDDPDYNDSRFEACKELVKILPFFDGVVPFDSSFKKAKYAGYFCTNHTQRPKAWHFVNEKMSTDCYSLNWGLERLHEVEYTMEYVRALGFKGKTPTKSFPYMPKSQKVKSTQKINIAFINGFFKEKSMLWERKAWPYFAELADILHYYYGVYIYLVGFNDLEKQWANKMQKNKHFVKSFVGELDILEEVDLLNNMDLVISSDTGLMHIADALFFPFVVGLFGSTLVSKNRPWNLKESLVIKAPVQCSGCQASTPVWKQCGDQWEENPDRGWPCMEAIKPDYVFNEIRKIFPTGLLEI